MSGWHPIETAPRDGTRVDLWIRASYAPHDRPPQGYRVTDAQWSPTSGWVQVIDAGSDAGGTRPLEYDGPGAFIDATHWRPIPDGPDAD
ncbi:hypothetical protein [Muricoccus radiodurans]|uniref:hypothetical protein n=1 Tax=Muricoccus radiodurans TaxID=2231721 RepID=UPI003CFA6406